jgi:DNA-binding CsgD family transcriptional regulator
MPPPNCVGPASRSPRGGRGWGGRYREVGAAGGHMLTRRRTTAHVDLARLALVEPRRAGVSAGPGHLIAPLCVLAVGAAFVAEVMVGGDNVTLGALAVVPVLASSMLRARSLTLIVVAFAMVLQVWGVAAEVINRDAAGMQIAVYLLTMALSALQQSRSPQAAIEAARRGHLVAAQPVAPAPVFEAEPPAVLRVTGVQAPPTLSAVLLPDTIAQRLTPRERDVVVLAVRGYTAREIGGRLFIGERTVETHLGNAYGKLGVRSKLELVRLASTLSGNSPEFRTGTEAPAKATA